MTVQILDSIALWDGTRGVILTPLGFGAGVVEENDLPDRIALALEGSTALQRGYVAHWEIRGRELWLVAVHGRLRLTDGQPLPAEWVRGDLRIGIGSPPEKLHDAYFGNYQSQIRLEVDEGLVETAWRMERLL